MLALLSVCSVSEPQAHRRRYRLLHHVAAGAWASFGKRWTSGWNAGSPSNSCIANLEHQQQKLNSPTNGRCVRRDSPRDSNILTLCRCSMWSSSSQLWLIMQFIPSITLR